MPTHHPYTGASAFAHKGGLHASAIARFPEAYEHARPETVGNTQRMLVSELAGKASLVAKAKSLGIDLTLHADKTQAILDDIKHARGARLLLRDGRRLARACCCNGTSARTVRTSRWRASASSWTIAKTRAPSRRTP